MPTPKVEQFKKQPWQAKDIQKFLKLAPWSCNFNKMGCFKTSTALWLMEDLKVPFALVITTKTGKGSYFSDAPRTIPGWRVINIDNKGAYQVLLNGDLQVAVDLEKLLKDLPKSGKPTLVVTHYHLYTNRSKMLPPLLKVKWPFILVDEAHRMKNRKAQWTKNIKKLRQTPTGYKHIMTGTGFINSPDEVWSPLNFCDKADFSSYWRFRRYYCDEMVIGGFSKIIGIKQEHLADFRAMREKISTSRTMQEVHPSITKPLRREILVTLSPIQRRMFDEIKADLFTLDQQGFAITSPNVVSQLQRLRAICVATPEIIEDYFDEKEQRRIQKIRLTEPSSKLDALMQFIEGLSWDDEYKDQVVVYSNFVGPLSLLETRLQKKNISYLWMMAKHGDATRYSMWHDQWPQKKHQVFMCTLQLGSESINLSSAQYVTFLDRSWSPKDNEQAESRLWRPGQKGVVEVVDIIAAHTTDQRILKTNERKLGWYADIFGD